jgi:phenylpropionate dioxygenase-like ring-hydroxylating dioxygenase large terminal subunit
MAIAADAYAELGIDPEAVERALQANMTFPASWYSDPKIYAYELDQIFARCWHVVAPIDQLAKPGDHVAGSAGHIPVLLTRDRAGELHGFVNVCRHRAYPVASGTGNRKTLQCRYHGWTYELDGRLRTAPGCGFEEQFDKREFSLMPVSVESFGGFAWANPDPDPPPLRDSYPQLESLFGDRDVSFDGYGYVRRYTYDIEANWKVYVENATECYHCPTIHSKSFSDAFDVSRERYEYVNVGRILAQFADYNAKGKRFAHEPERGDRAFRFIYVWPSSFVALDDMVAFSGMIVPTGPETCRFDADMFVRPGLSEAEVEHRLEMYTLTLEEDAEAVRIQQPGLRSRMVPHGRLMPSRESAIIAFHRMVWDAIQEGLGPWA